MAEFTRDVRYATRLLAKSPGFSCVAILTVALGIGANTAVFSVLSNVVLRPLPYEEPYQLVRIHQPPADRPEEKWYVTGPSFRDYREMLPGFASVAALCNNNEFGVTLTGAGSPKLVTVLPVSADFFEVYRSHPIIGRGFLREEEVADARVAVLSYRLWRSAFEGNPKILGRYIELDNVRWEVVGVMPASFLDLVGGDVDLWVPHDFTTPAYVSPITSSTWNQRSNHYLSVIARLREGTSISDARAQLTALAANQAVMYPDTLAGMTATVIPLHDDVVGGSDTLLYLLMGAAGLVLLIACVNVASLLLARNAVREREFAVRAALGSGRDRLIRQLLTESLVLAVIGGVAGIGVAYSGMTILLGLEPDSLPRTAQIVPDAQMLLFAIATTVLTGFIFGLAPALQSTTLNPDRSLRAVAKGSTRGRRMVRSLNVLVACQVTLAVMLLAGAGLLIRSFLKLQRVDLGLAPEHAMTFQVHLPDVRYAVPSDLMRFHQEFQDRIAAITGVERVGAASWLPISGRYNNWGFRVITGQNEEISGNGQFRIIEGDYFQALNITLLSGRYFERTDDADAPLVAIINESTAREYFEGRNAIGQEILLSGFRLSVVGIVRDVALDHRANMARKVYLAHAQAVSRKWALNYVVSTATARPDLMQLVRRELAELDPALVVHNVRTMQEVQSTAVAREKLALLLMGVFAATALALASVGIYGVLAHTTTQRTREIGILMALGANARSVRLQVVRHGLLVAAAGAVVGLCGALGLSRLLGSILFNVGVRDPLTFATVPFALFFVVAVSAYLPARRASQVDPMDAIRYE